VWSFSQKYVHVVSSDGVARPLAEGSDVADRVHVVYSSNSGSFVGLLASMISLARNTLQPSMCIIHIIVQHTAMPEAEELVCFTNELQDQRQTPDVQLHEMQPLPICWDCERKYHSTHFWVPEAFVRLYLPNYLPNVSRAVWLDTDTIVQGDIGRLFWRPMKHAVAAALESNYTRQALYDATPPEIAANISWVEASRMFNSGVMVLDLDRWRRDNLTNLCTIFFRMVHGVHADQMTLNAVFQLPRFGFDVLDPTFNVGCMTLPYSEETADTWHSGIIPKSGFILHWSCSWEKPWVQNRTNRSKAQDYLWLKYQPQKCTKGIR